MTGKRHCWTASDIIQLIAQQDSMVKILRAVEALNLADCWIGAGFVRNTIWDALHDRPWSPSYGDVDVVYFDARDVRRERDEEISAGLTSAMPAVPWSVKNQARMHVRNGDPPYADTADALRHWSETCTAVAVRCVGPDIELLAPFGISDLVSMTVTPTPAFERKPETWQVRLVGKGWLRRWPSLHVVPTRG